MTHSTNGTVARIRKGTETDIIPIQNCYDKEDGMYLDRPTLLETIQGLQEGNIIIADSPMRDGRILAIASIRLRKWQGIWTQESRGWYCEPSLRRHDLTTTLVLFGTLYQEYQSWGQYLPVARVKNSHFIAQRLLGRLGFQPYPTLQVEAGERAFVLSDTHTKLSAFAMAARIRMEQGYLASVGGDRLRLDFQHPIASFNVRHILSSIEAMEFDRPVEPLPAPRSNLYCSW